MLVNGEFGLLGTTCSRLANNNVHAPAWAPGRSTEDVCGLWDLWLCICGASGESKVGGRSSDHTDTLNP